jgi:hypothetical protein
MLVCELFEHKIQKNLHEDQWHGRDDQWSGPDDQYSNSDQWHNGRDPWHSQDQEGMVEGYEMSDIITARGLIGRALRDAEEKMNYFKYLKHLRDKHGHEYSTSVHREAGRLAKGSTHDV